MTEHKTRELLPFFVAGTLTAGQEAEVRRALATSESLRKELRFWQQAEAVVRARSAHVAAGHLTPRDLVDRAMGVLVGDRMLAVDRHLQACPQCSEELSLVAQSVGPSIRVPQPSAKRPAAILRYFRPIYLVPATLAVIAAAVLILRDPGQSSRPSETPVLPAPSMVTAPEDKDDTAVFSLSYHPHMRSATHTDTPVMVIASNHRRVLLVVAIPHTALEGIQYRCILRGGEGRPQAIQEPVEKFASGETYDSLRCIIPRALLPASDARVTLKIVEVLPRSSRDLAPEEYSMDFFLRVKP